jgi:hypothetical protein
MKLLKYILFCALPIIFSCQDDIPDDLPDHTVENLEGSLNYNEEEKIWEFQYVVDLDILGSYVIINPGNKFRLEKDKKVRISGSCYLKDSSLSKKSIYFLYLTDITYLKKNKLVKETCLPAAGGQVFSCHKIPSITNLWACLKPR